MADPQVRDPTSSRGRAFRNRYRLPWLVFRVLVMRAIFESWFGVHLPLED